MQEGSLKVRSLARYGSGDGSYSDDFLSNLDAQVHVRDEGEGGQEGVILAMMTLGVGVIYSERAEAQVFRTLYVYSP